MLRDAKTSYAKSVQDSIDQERLGPREFWRITYKILNRGKSPIPAIINGPGVISSSLDKAKVFGSIFASNSSRDDFNYPLPDIPSRTDCLVSDFRISVREVSRQVHDLESTKATGPDQVPVVVLKNFSPEISPILEKLFNRCVKEKCVPSSWKVSSVCPIFKNSGERSSPSQYRPINLLSVISKIIESILNRHILNHLSKNNLLAVGSMAFDLPGLLLMPLQSSAI